MDRTWSEFNLSIFTGLFIYFFSLTGQVQLQLVTATVKLFLKKPQSTQNIVWRLLQIATSECDNPDIRDRAYVYWRLLSTDPQAAKVNFF